MSNVAGFTWEDVQALKPEWTQEQCETAFNVMYKTLHERLVEEGWQVLKVLLAINNWSWEDEGNE